MVQRSATSAAPTFFARSRHALLTPYGKGTHGHFSHYYAAIWKPYLMKFMSGLPLVSTEMVEIWPTLRCGVVV